MLMAADRTNHRYPWARFLTGKVESRDGAKRHQRCDLGKAKRPGQPLGGQPGREPHCKISQAKHFQRQTPQPNGESQGWRRRLYTYLR